MKICVFDSGPLINYSMNGLLSILEELRANFKGKFLITPYVKSEIYDRPLKIQQFEWGALRLNHLIEKKVLEMPDSIGISSDIVESRTKELMDCANHSFRAGTQWIQLVSDAEMSCIAVAQAAQLKGHEVMLVIDERTARLLCEKPENIAALMSQKLHTKVTMEDECSTTFKKLPCIRSAELVYAAYKKNLIEVKHPQALESLLYATKFKGAAISFQEINTLKKL